jgi:hypothetical protein
MSELKSKRDERRRIRDEMSEVCASCGVTFGRHGAAPPHTRGDDCRGFRAVGEKEKP